MQVQCRMRGEEARGKGGDSADRGKRGRGRGEIAVGGGGFELNLRHGARREGRGGHFQGISDEK